MWGDVHVCVVSMSVGMRRDQGRGGDRGCFYWRPRETTKDLGRTAETTNRVVITGY